MNDSSTFRYTLRNLLTALALVAIGLGLLVNFGPLSALVASLAAAAMLAIGFRYFKNWQSYGVSKRLFVCIWVTICCALVFGISAGLWMHTQVHSNRINTIYSSSTISNLKFSIFRGKVLFVTVSGTVETENAFNTIRSDVLRRFDYDPSLHIKWNVRTNEGKLNFDGTDRELFPSDYQSEDAA
jgi:predicted PurR-regulated permease PerM